MKLIGSLMLIVATTCVGINEFLLIKKRISYLEQMLTFIDRLMTEIRYLASPVFEIMETMKEREELPILIREIFAQDISFSDTITNTDESIFQKYGLKKGDIDQLKGFLNELGRSDINGQIANCRLYKTQIEYELELVRRDVEKKGKMYLSLGLISGLTVALLFV